MGARARAAARADAAARVGADLRSTTSPAGRARPSSRCRSCSRCARRAALPFTLDELHGAQPWRRPRGQHARRRARSPLADRVLGPLRPPAAGGACGRPALARAERWIVRRQEADGSWGGIQPPWVYSLIALHLRGYPIDHPVIRAGLDGLERFTIHETRQPRLEACQSPVWDTALAVVALADAGVAPDHPAMLRAADWLLDEQVPLVGDWAVRRPALRPGGWSFEFANDYYPDVDDTAEVVLALLRVAHPDREPRRRRRSRAASNGSRACRTASGGWGAFDAANTKRILRDVPFCDFGEVIDPPSADVTAHALEMLAAAGRADGDGRAARARLADRRAGGRRLLVRALGRQPRLRHRRRACRRSSPPASRPSDERIRRAVRWLEEPPERRRRLGRGRALLPRPRLDRPRRRAPPRRPRGRCSRCDAAGERSEAVERGVRFLVDDPARGRRLGRAAVHRHRLPRRLLHQLPPLPRRSSRSWRWRGARAEPRAATAAPRRRSAARARADARRGARGPRRRAVERGSRRSAIGPRRARAAAPLTRDPRRPPALIAGFCGALDPTLEPGDVVLASELRTPDARRSPAPTRRSSPASCAAAGCASTSARSPRAAASCSARAGASSRAVRRARRRHGVGVARDGARGAPLDDAARRARHPAPRDPPPGARRGRRAGARSARCARRARCSRSWAAALGAARGGARRPARLVRRRDARRRDRRARARRARRPGLRAQADRPQRARRRRARAPRRGVRRRARRGPARRDGDLLRPRRLAGGARGTPRRASST